MAAVSGYPAEGEAVPPQFQDAVEALQSAPVRAEVRLDTAKPPQRLAPYSFAMTGRVTVEGKELADGRLVLLYDPDGHEAWQGSFRIVTLARADLEPEIAADPLLPEVGWSWLICSLDGHRARYREPSGTVSRCSSHYFGGLGGRPETTQIEIRASWTPGEARQAPDLAPHLSAWCDLLCVSGGLPPTAPEIGTGAHPGGPQGGVVPLPNRRPTGRP